MMYWVDQYWSSCVIFFVKVPWLDAIYAVLGAILFTMVRAQTLLCVFALIVTAQHIKQKHKTKCRLTCSLILCPSFWPSTRSCSWGTSATPWVRRSTSSPRSAFTLTSSTSSPSSSKSLVESPSDPPLTPRQETCYRVSLVLQYKNLPTFPWLDSAQLHCTFARWHINFAWMCFSAIVC